MKRKFILLVGMLLAGLSVMEAKTMQRNVVYKDAHVRFTVVSDGVVRMEYSPAGCFVDDKSFVVVNRAYPQVDYQLKTKGRWVEIITSKMKLRYLKDSGCFTEKNLTVSSRGNLVPFVWHPGMRQSGNLKGTYRTLDGMDGNVQTQKWVRDTQKGDTLALEDGLLSTDGWTLIDDSQSHLFDGDKKWEWVKERPADGNQDWIFMAYGHDYKSALKDYILFAGRMPLPPRYAFGYWWSRYWLYSDKEFRRLIDNFHRYDIPLDVLVVDMDWHYTEKGKGGWTGWTWNRELFPSPEGFLRYVKAQNLKVTLNLHPAGGVASYEEQYAEMAKSMGLNPAEGKTIHWINSDKCFMNSMFDQILTPMEKSGVDFWWLDWQQDLYDPKVKGLNNTWWINYAFFSRMERNRNTRPLLYHRWGGLGNHRYQVGFSGDAVISWKSLEYQPYFNSTASNVLYGYWSHDLGGHIGSRIDPEMYVRWLQFGAFSPIMRTHSQKSAELNKEPWAFSRGYSDIVRETICRRYTMAPYIYTMARKGYDEGLSLCRPLYYDWPEQSQAYRFRNEYMFGDAMLVSPATAPSDSGYLKVRTWLPEGDWFEWSSGTLLSGGQVVERNFALDEYPVYVKGGAILPFYTDKVKNLNGNDEEIVVTVFPGGEGFSCFDLYEDNGNDKNYDSQYAVTHLESCRKGNKQTIVVGGRKGMYKDMPVSRPFKVKVLLSHMPESVSVNGQPAKYTYQAEEFALLVELPVVSCEQEKRVEIVYGRGNSELNGLPGITRRMSKSMEALKYRNSYICFKEELGKMGSLNETVLYYPDEMENRVAEFWKSWSELPAVLERQGLKKEDVSWFLRNVGWERAF
ncbi:MULTISPECIES: glycoside hydrolase family 31 protein [Bacteroides]|uniref:Glycoside hydrolase family 31 protein n=1 Tax=Bacteroides gallinaceum TaxID=1462571 RepID=A0ABT7VDL4_9BACE|nr:MULTISPECIES: glycoside hydrolase family 31 protein [Bacteroides]MCR8917657.1 glycoside hydrolase family 31 protein [Bacteroides sp. ET225]MDM8324255.1 glycoside hydrolase family 31 protein [Bacteroides gallinaceum]